MVLPFILILDVDQATIGDIEYCAHEWHILELIFKNCIEKNKDFPTKCIKREMIDLQEELQKGLLRPNAKDFIDYCKKRFKKHLEIFFYTNASYTWATTGSVPQIEKALQIKANRPIFTFENSIGYTKTIANIAPFIQKTLIKKYPLLAKENHLQTLFNERMIFIDDIKDNVFDYKSRQIVCPEYNFIPYYDIYEKIINKYNIPASVFDTKEIHEYMKREKLPLYTKNGSIYQQNKEYALLHNMLKTKEYEVYNASLAPDTFFNDMITAFTKIDTFTDKEIAKINKSLSKPSS